MNTTSALLSTKPAQNNGRSRDDHNKIRPEDRAVHDWYRFVLSFPPHLVQDYLQRFGTGPSDTVLDPFCGTGTTLVECKKSGIGSVGIESNPMAHFASSVKIDWSCSPSAIEAYAASVESAAGEALERDGVGALSSLPMFAAERAQRPRVRDLGLERTKLLLKDSISPVPLHKSLVLLDAIDRHGDDRLRRYGRLALASALVRRVGNLKFGPEVGIGKIKDDAPVLDSWMEGMCAIARDIGGVKHGEHVRAQAIEADSRRTDLALEPESVDAVITSPPYPNEKDYTRTTRLESVVLGLVRNKMELRSLKQGLIRSNTRGVYKSDADDREVADNEAVQAIAESIEQRRIALGKTSGFERQYARVTRLYFGGMVKHLASLRAVLKPGAKLAYVVGDQASYLRVMIRTGQILAELAKPLGYEVAGIDLFRTRPSTVTGSQLREEVVLLEWPGTRS